MSHQAPLKPKLNDQAKEEKSPKDYWWVYIIRCQDGVLYTGITNHLIKRWQAHNSGKGGAKFFRSRKPEQLVYLEYPHNRRSASQREYAIKQLSRREKLHLIDDFQAQSPTST